MNQYRLWSFLSRFCIQSFNKKACFLLLFFQCAHAQLLPFHFGTHSEALNEQIMAELLSEMMFSSQHEIEGEEMAHLFLEKAMNNRAAIEHAFIQDCMTAYSNELSRCECLAKRFHFEFLYRILSKQMFYKHYKEYQERSQLNAHFQHEKEYCQVQFEWSW